jgi:two-component system invasion response regulator UvrY
MQKPSVGHAGSKPRRVVVVGDSVVSEVGMAAIVGRDKSYRVCGGAHAFCDAEQLIRRHRPHVLLIEPFLENCDGIRRIKDLATNFPKTRILIVSLLPERTYAERAFRAGAAGYWMKNGSVEQLLKAVETVAAGEIYISSVIALLAVHRLAGQHRNGDVADRLSALSDRKIAVFSLIAEGEGIGRIAQELGISRKTVETHCEHIKYKLGYRDAEAPKDGARGLLGRQPSAIANP